MKVLSPDFERFIEIPGVAAPVSRPVDIDQAQTGFHTLRTLRIYRFAEQMTIEGHAEEDEVWIVVLAGTITLQLNGDAAVTLTVAGAAYLPPGGAYTLVAVTDAAVAYARTTPVGMRPVLVIPTLLGETTHAERMRLRVLRWEAGGSALAPGDEGLVHVQAEGVVLVDDVPLRSWDTAVLVGNARLVLPRESSGLVLVVSGICRREGRNADPSLRSG